MTGWICNLKGRSKKCIHDFGEKSSWQETTWKTKKEIGG
jgi:hypothetical protein